VPNQRFLHNITQAARYLEQAHWLISCAIVAIPEDQARAGEAESINAALQILQIRTMAVSGQEEEP
jgi:hypothetical protein